jgi:hypothetical protein
VLALAATPALARGLDEGKLDPAWFPGVGEFREADEVDYLWVKPGFSLEAGSVRFAEWEPAVFLGEEAGKRDAKDKRLANELSAELPGIFTEAIQNTLAGRVKLVKSGEKVRAVGRIVDCSTGSTAAKFWVGMGAGSGNTTFDLKFVDAESGEVLAAIHHRVVSGSNLSTTSSKLVDWVDELADTLVKEPLEKVYQSGKKAKN